MYELLNDYASDTPLTDSLPDIAVDGLLIVENREDRRNIVNTIRINRGIIVRCAHGSPVSSTFFMGKR